MAESEMCASCVLGGVVVWAVVLSMVDARTSRLPDALTLPGTMVVVIASVMLNPWALIQGWLWPASQLLVALGLKPRSAAPGVESAVGIGGGDIKYTAGLGPAVALAAGLGGVIVAMGIAAVASAVFMVVTRRDRAPHGPFLSIGGIAALACGG